VTRNYAGGIQPQAEAAAKGFSQILWLLGDKVTEVCHALFYFGIIFLFKHIIFLSPSSLFYIINRLVL
jgi:hypothetical protein